MAYPSSEQGTTSFNAVECANLVGSVIAGTQVNSPTITGSSISGSTLALPTGMPGVAQIITGSTAAANATVSATHGLGSTPAFVSLTSEGTSGGAQLMSKTASLIHVQAHQSTLYP